ncbi:MAG: Nif3-like dinuclear metal center hexameric protein [Clostridia bacterium]|nr:Nif3-like dinuclear metal center hexameric protein [Clostridia bacterium]
MAVFCRDVMEAVEKIAPRELAEKWDNVGLLVGNPAEKVEKIIVALDVTPEVVEEALQEGAHMIVSHHPLIFKPLTHVRADTPMGDMLFKLIKNNVKVYAAHTNLDNYEWGTNYFLAQKLGLEETEILKPAEEGLYKIVVFVPRGYEDRVRDAMGDAGAGWIGNYSHCSFMAPGTGTFKPLEGADPFIGSKGKLEKVEELRLETIVPESLRNKVIRAMLNAHPYEEVAYDVYRLENNGSGNGLGRIGYLKEEMSLYDFGEKVKRDLGIKHVKLAGPLKKAVRKVAVCGGAGTSAMAAAKKKGAEVFVSGDIKYHEALEAWQEGLALVDAGHYATEWAVVPALAEYLRKEFNGTEQKVQIMVSQVKTDPWEVI